MQFAIPLSSIWSEPLTNVGPPVLDPLETGDQLTRGEFLRRLDAVPEEERAELIEGIVFMAAAVRHPQHGRPQRLLIAWLDRYIEATPGSDGGLNATVVLDEDNVPQPDAYLLLPSEVGGQCQVVEAGYLEGPPALVAEVSASTKSIDLHLKFQAYRRNGISEYIVWRVRDKAIDWFVLQDGDYQLLPPDADGILKSRICPGLWLDPVALVKRRTKRVQEVLELGMATPEYREFAKRVAQFATPEEE